MDKVAIYKPELTPQQAADLIQRLYGLTTKEITRFPSYYDQNFCIKTTSDSTFVLKITNSLDSNKTRLLEVQTQALSFLQDCGLPVQVALRNTAEERLSFEELDCGHGHQTYCVRLLDYMPGVTVSESAVTQEDLYDVGRMGAALSRAMLKIEHPNLDVLNLSANKAWDIGHIHLVEQYLSVMDGDPVQDIIKEVIQGIKSQVLPKLGSFPTGITHGDFSDQNILVSPVGNGHHKVSGIIDFTFLCRKCFVNEVAVSIAYLMVENPSPLNVGGAVLAGWESLIPLSDDERDCLFLLVLGRLCQSLVYGRHNSLQSSENKDYFLVTARNGFKILNELWTLGKQKVEQIWFLHANKMSRDMKEQ
ncbi:unnamed protein product [Knipowitschia caucasica]